MSPTLAEPHPAVSPPVSRGPSPPSRPVALSAGTSQRPEVRAPSFSQVKVADIFHRLVSAFPPPRPRGPQGPGLRRPPVSAPGGAARWGAAGQAADLGGPQGPLSVFSAKNRWRLGDPVHVTRGEGGFGFTLRGDAPVLIAAVVPGGQAAVRRGGRRVGAGVRVGRTALSCPAGGRPPGGRLHRVGGRAAVPVVEARGGGGAAEGRGRRGREPAGGDPAARGARHGEPRPPGGPRCGPPSGTPSAPHAPLGWPPVLTAVHSPTQGDRRPLRGLLRSQERGREPAPAGASPRPLLGWSRKAKRGKTGGRPSPAPRP